ncbi:terminase large subunit [Yersinia phage fHe-Yen8-01]|nr:terminase large subunit [Yersinia phage fHe-Yen8-01]
MARQKEIKIKLPLLTDALQVCIDRSARFNVMAMGEKAGKTTLGIEAITAGKQGVLNNPYPCAWLSSTYKDLMEVRRRIVKALDPIIKSATSRRITLLSGQYIDLYAAENMKDVGGQYGLIVIDDVREQQDFLRLWGDMLEECLREYHGGAWFISGAYGKQNDFYRLWEQAELDPDWFRRRVPTSSNLVNLDDDFIHQMGEATEQEHRQRYDAEFLETTFILTASQKILKPGETFLQWCIRLGESGLKVDGRPFKLDNRPAMAWIYAQIPSTIEEAYRRTLVLMKCAQVGFTVMEMLATIYLGLRFQPMTIGMFLPDAALAGIKSSERFMPIVRTVPEVHSLMVQDDENGKGRRKGEGNVRTRRIGEAMFVFSWTSGRSTTESIPMDVLSFDEVQEMTLEQMEKTRERLSASPVRYSLMGSTANWPDSDIHHWYKLGSQFRFHTECPTCLVKRPLDDYFPECIKYDIDTRTHRYVCKDCGGWIDDTQKGEWIPDAPENESAENMIRSAHFPQFLSPTISPGEIISAYNSATDMKNFFNRKLGKPYLDPSLVPVTLEHMSRCVEAGKRFNVQWKTRGKDCYMGIDQMGNFNVVVIKERLPSGRQAIVHIEMIFDADPFARCDELMYNFGVAACVVEINPNYNDAKRFANRHKGRVFICNSFGSIVEGMIQWGDSMRLDKSDTRTDDNEQDRYTLKMDQYKCMQVSMARFTADDPICLIPDPQGLVQDVKEKGGTSLKAVAPIMFMHFTKTALVAEKDDETNQYKRSVKKIGIDPHFSYANMLCDVAWSRAHGTSTFIMPDIEPAKIERLSPADIGVDPNLVHIINEVQAVQYRGDVCGRCINFDRETNTCAEIMMQVKAKDIGCSVFLGRED